ncbi:hypothetical protein QVD17_02155 [Tagetes erecta]|uniref:RING-type E3 ubiquitin transferase n=1 Tax=Tagetes erecta TaxID=13708 RepID=A0AAD8LC44_TARER|nr:hypothetical protein QVD17_02155 [Tagetes erecta]
MASTTHRKLLLQQHSDLNSTCSDCGPTCPYNCTYPDFYWPPQPPPIPQHTITTTTTTNHISPYAIVIVTLLASAFLFFSYYLIMIRCSTRFRRRPETQISDHAHEERGFEVDHPIWYINTIGLQSSVINSISVFKYKKDDNLIDGTDCSVCLCEFQDNETLRLLPKCNHAFHVPCIDTWLRSHTNCPICRAGILSNSLSAVLGPDDTSATGSNRNTQMENLDDRGGSSGNGVMEIEICDENEELKTEYESGSISMDDCVARELEMISGDSM